jgi:EmrB/QacA subfamily drug resistance transporter
MVSSTPAADTAGRNKWLVLVVISFSLFMILLDVTIVNIALPHIMNSLKVSLSSIEWVINVYTLVFAVLLLTMGKLGDLFGRKRLFMIGLALFTISSLGCSLAPNYPTLILARGIQAIGGATMMPATLSILNVEFSKNQRGLALGVWGAVAGAANALGPIIGGSLVDSFSWRYIFLINIPIGIFAFIAAMLIVRESKDPNVDRHIDYPGVALISAALFCLTFALIQGQSYGWTSATILCLFAGALAGLVAFVFLELKTARPLAQLRLFKNRTYAAGNFIGVVINFGLIGVIFLTVLYLQIVLGLKALEAGLWFLPLPVAIMAVAPFAGKLTDKIGGRWILLVGTLISALGLVLLSRLSISTAWTDFLLPLLVCGIGMGLVMAPVTTVVMASTPVQQSGMGAGILSTMRQIGSVMGIAVLGAILQNQLVTNVTSAVSQIQGLPAAIRDQIIRTLTSGNFNMSQMNTSGSLPAGVVQQMVEMFKNQYTHSLEVSMKVGIIVVLLGTIASLFIAGNIKKVQSNVQTDAS